MQAPCALLAAVGNPNDPEQSVKKHIWSCTPTKAMGRRQHQQFSLWQRLEFW
jgi:hypothetical protein